MTRLSSVKPKSVSSPQIACVHLTFQQFMTLPWALEVREKLPILAEREDVLALSAAGTATGLRARVWTIPPVLANQLFVWVKNTAEPEELVHRSLLAADLVEQRGMSVVQACKAIGVSRQSVYQTLARRRFNVVCPCCNQTVRKGFSLDKSVLKDSGENDDSATTRSVVAEIA